ncbi:hypothetical protein DPMN_130166 [Dreissena polymorpha]|uniref:Uncharacterized protein n=1 Tax=Dreissena polymorpha TaxID=45954 RepID=A0A9D4JYY8_DREPO|nr:hypothetical protein DPMN_130137 [Dreissena polymorpha]KAH3828214.1 hypothetical protein DPMN_130166 [Dreissena polymorpha]
MLSFTWCVGRKSSIPRLPLHPRPRLSRRRPPRSPSRERLSPHVPLRTLCTKERLAYIRSNL